MFRISMNKIFVIIFLAFIAVTTGLSSGLSQPTKRDLTNEKIKLPSPRYDSTTSVEKALLERRSVRDLRDEPLTINEVSQLLWAAQGITDSRGFRTAPSAGALYPLEVYMAIVNIKGISKGTYKYNPHKHELAKVKHGDVRNELTLAALGQYWIRKGAVVIVLSAVYERTTKKYGERGNRYVHMEVGHAAQNIYLQAQSLDLGTVVIGAFWDEAVRKVMNMPDEEHPLCIMPVGRK
jgi:SagB-type dehydrogenase family enzyme